MLSPASSKFSIFKRLSAYTDKNLTHPSEIDIYFEPPPISPRAPSFVEQQLNTVFETLSTATSAVKPACLIVYNAGSFTVDYGFRSRKDPILLLKPGVIGIATLGGMLYAGKKGKAGKISKVAYGCLSGGLVTAAVNPKVTFDLSKDLAKSGFEKLFDSFKHVPQEKPVSEKVIEEKIPETSETIQKSSANIVAGVHDPVQVISMHCTESSVDITSQAEAVQPLKEIITVEVESVVNEIDASVSGVVRDDSGSDAISKDIIEVEPITDVAIVTKSESVTELQPHTEALLITPVEECVITVAKRDLSVPESINVLPACEDCSEAPASNTFNATCMVIDSEEFSMHTTTNDMSESSEEKVPTEQATSTVEPVTHFLTIIDAPDTIVVERGCSECEEMGYSSKSCNCVDND